MNLIATQGVQIVRNQHQETDVREKCAEGFCWCYVPAEKQMWERNVLRGSVGAMYPQRNSVCSQKPLEMSDEGDWEEMHERN
jgi:hypothetical protein